MTRDHLVDEYFDWIYNLVCGDRYAKQISYRKLLARLHGTEFTYLIPLDENRAENGIALRWRFIYEHGYEDIRDEVKDALAGPCSVLEMMVSLALHCEEDIMDDPRLGDRTGQWFWGMISNLGLGSMMDRNFDKQYTDEVIQRFLNREYEPDGTGGLFKIRNCRYDLRKVEIQHQLYWYLNTIT